MSPTQNTYTERVIERRTLWFWDTALQPCGYTLDQEQTYSSD